MDQSIRSVGVDIGTSTTSLIVSNLWAVNDAPLFTAPKVRIQKKEIIYKSQIYKTPLIHGTQIDGEALKKIMAFEYAKAGITPGEIQSGAIIITGESARKENAENVTKFLSQFAGNFVVATAGPDLESTIAGKGSGACGYSIEHDCTVANLDIGGGTTNIAVFQRGQLLEKGCLDIGGQLIRMDAENRISYIAPSVEKLAAAKGIKLIPGLDARPQLMEEMASLMAGAIEGAFEQPVESSYEKPYEQEEKRALFLAVQTKGSSHFRGTSKLDGIFFSGGVGACYYSPEPDLYKYRDIGAFLAKALHKSSLPGRYHVLQPKETIRATVVGAGMYSITVSGSTIDVNRSWLPAKNIPVMAVSPEVEEACCQGSFQELREQMRWFTHQSQTEQMAISFKGRKNMRYIEICNMAKSIVKAAEDSLPVDAPILVLLENDVAKALGQSIKKYAPPSRCVLCIDEITATGGEYIDIGNPIVNGLALPVVVKTLVFQ